MNFLKFYFILFFLYNSFVFAQEKINQLDAQGRKHGVWSKNYDNGNIRYKGQFEHGKEIGKFEFFAENGNKKPIATKEYSSTNDSIKVKFYNSKGILESEGTMMGKNNEGVWKYYFTDGKTLMRTEFYKNNLLEGEVKIFYKTGKTTEISNYFMGKRNGICKRYDEDGKIVEDLTYKEGTLHGPANIYNEKGELYAKGNYENGIRVGEWDFKLNGKWIKTKNPDKIINNR